MPPLAELLLAPAVTEVVTTSLWSHVYTAGGVLLVLFALARLAGERRQPGNTLAWLLVIVLLPYVGVPLFFLFGGRKIRRLAARKRRIRLPSPPGSRASAATLADPVAQAIRTSGAGDPVGGNSVRLLGTGEEAFAELERRIRAARYSIHIATYILGRDRVGRQLVELLAERARAGVKVRLQLDALGCFFASGSFVDPLRAAGGEVAKFLPVIPLSSRGSANLRNHRKIAIFDHTTAIVGGHNLAEEYMGPYPWRKRWTDLGAVIHGPAAALLDDVFLADWSFATRRAVEPTPLPPPAPASVIAPFIPAGAPGMTSELQVVASGPDVSGDPLYEGMLAMIQEATHSIWIVTPYFLPDEVLLRTLIVKARTGRDVTLILPARSNHPVTDLARRPYLRQLVRSGARVLAYQPRMLHAKAIIVDDRLALIGSANVDMRSLFVNFEIGVVLHTATDVHAIRAWAGALARDARQLHLGDLKRRRFPANLAEDLSRLLTPLL
ncbi:MAG: phospholipase D-like domain-containing protein [Verrucomicrobia bacterium]|nr:phospholipase D-like domain-containing protein [Verrucomicrobiota bacterium]